MEDRRLMEEIFSAGLLAVLTCTSTLAMGVNLSTHLMAIKSTQQMVAGAWQEYFYLRATRNPSCYDKSLDLFIK